MSNFINIFVPSYHRPQSCKTVQYFAKLGWPTEKLHIFIDSETDDKEQYRAMCDKVGCNLVVFDMEEARRRYDYVHRPTPARRSAGQARNMFQDYAKSIGIDFYCVIDDDTTQYQIRFLGEKVRKGSLHEISNTFYAMREFMKRQRIGIFGIAQTGDFIGGLRDNKIYQQKVMNTTFYNVPYIYRGERGVQDDDTSMFVGVYNAGLFTGSTYQGIVLQQIQSAKQSGGLTDLYKEAKLLNKSLVVPIQFPSAVYAESQKMNGGRLHHHIVKNNIIPKIIKNAGGRSNIAWDTYPEDYPFTNEPNRNVKL